MLQWSSYSYWRDLPVDGFETYIRPGRGWAAMATNDGLTMLVVGWPMAEVAAYKADIEGNYRATLELVPAFAARVRAATRVERFGGGSVPNFFRQQHGPGWVLVGDAGYTRDSITGQGISDAFLDAERIAGALDDVLRGRRSFDGALGDAQRRRDEAVAPMYDFTTQLARLDPPPPDLAQLLGDRQHERTGDGRLHGDGGRRALAGPLLRSRPPRPAARRRRLTARRCCR